MLAASPATDRAAFRRYVDTLDLSHHYPGINGLGVISYVPRARLAAFESTARADGAPAYRVWPAGRRAVYFPVRYVEPLGPNRRALGYDENAESLRRAAVEHARDTGLPTRTAKITLVQDATRSPGFLLILPLYRRGVDPGTVAARRAALVGWVYAPVRVPALVQGLIGPRNAGLDVSIFDGTRPTPATLLYGKATRSTPAGALIQTTRLDLAGSAWTLRVTTQPTFDAALGPYQPLLILLAGAGFSVLLGALALLLVTGRARALALATHMTASLRASEERDGHRAVRVQTYLRAPRRTHLGRVGRGTGRRLPGHPTRV